MPFKSINPEKLLQQIRSEFPNLIWKSYKFVDEGWDHRVIILDDEIVFRFPDDNEYLALFRAEPELLNSIRPKIKVKIPEYIYMAKDRSFGGYKIVDGTQLTKQYFDSLSTESVERLASQLAEFISVLHNFDLNDPVVSHIPKSDIKSHHARLVRQTPQFLKDVLSNTEYKLCLEILDEINRILQEKTPQVFIHGDLYNRHLLWDDKAPQLGIIDFSDRNIGDPAFEFNEFYEYGREFVEKVYSYYSGPKDKQFLERAWQFQRFMGIEMMIDHFLYNKTSFEIARETFDRIKVG